MDRGRPVGALDGIARGALMLMAEAGSFRDPNNKVYYGDGRVIRGLSAAAAEHWRGLVDQPFFRRQSEAGRIVATKALPVGYPLRDEIVAEGWAEALEHEALPFISYPYEWPFSMLKDAGLLHLDLIEQGVENGWTLKDATPYNVQWKGAKPIFIDVASFEPRARGERWRGYRQFCMMFLYPLLLRAHANIDYVPLLRSQLGGIPPIEAAKYFTGLRRLRRGVPTHVLFPAMVERRIARRERDAAPVAERREGTHSDAMVLGMIQGLRRLLGRLDIQAEHTAWSHYAQAHSYDDPDFAAKQEFVKRHAAQRRWRLAWDIGSNTGTFSRLCAEHCDSVVAIDGDHHAVEQLYRQEREAGGDRILPLVMDLANVSPSQGWGGEERKALDRRAQPDLVLCLALIHHLALSGNVPIRQFLGWLRRLNACLIIEFVSRDDEMVQKLLVNRKEKFPDYDQPVFDCVAGELFHVRAREPLKGGRRTIYCMEPR